VVAGCWAFYQTTSKYDGTTDHQVVDFEERAVGEATMGVGVREQAARHIDPCGFN
jgi:hypothetical protein